MIDKRDVIDRFIRYVKIDSQSNPARKATPSSDIQWNMANLLKEELEGFGIKEVSIDQHAYVMARISSNVNEEVSAIGFISHFDTSPDFKATDIQPQIHENYDGKPILLNKSKDLWLSPDEFPDLKAYKGQTLITTDGNTLLSADDKAGVTEIMTAAKYLMEHPEIRHGDICIGFTPDEEIGRGAHLFDVDKFGADHAYTMDGSQIGELEYENFNAAEAKITFYGKMVHPGYAKDKMINSMYPASKFINTLPENETPEKTEGREGFFHLTDIDGSVEKTTLQYIIRDHDEHIFESRKKLFQESIRAIKDEFGESAVDLKLNDQYFNMKKHITDKMHIVDIAKEAMEQLAIKPIIKPIRGGTDGAQLSYKGLPCPNIFAGGHNFHGPYEYVPAESMVKATEVIIKIAELTAQKQAV
ncbi:MAG: peptidase T [Psychroflexus sp.]|nr:peptidase T [Psychroflexus sp.]MDR9449274.1 peptidase T [Psychroflexus sp.]